ncbi:hypothetical protein ACMZOO_00785 [Catenovulum sp. SX2]|uniref:hypothetical protein n=1 Tax=Catenovulum sp. SX2 TaxID=3398614 RepID=UPI003F87D727
MFTSELISMNENNDYAKHMIYWLERLRVPNSQLANDSFEQLKEYWLNGKPIELEEMRNKLWAWVDKNNGDNTAHSKVVRMRMLLCLTYENNREIKDIGFFEDLLVSIGITHEEAYR